MGRPKLLLPVGGRPLVRRAVEAVAPHAAPILVVTGPDPEPFRPALAGLPVTFVVNPRPEDGQGSSIAAGVAALPAGTPSVLVVLGDQPELPPSVVPALLAAREATGKAIAAPVYRGTQGTPVLFGAEVFAELRGLAGDAGARAVVRARPERVVLVPIDAAMPADVDTPEDYRRLRGPDVRVE